MVLRAHLTALTCALALVSCSPAKGVPILLWHSVGEGNPDDKYDVPAEEFDRELSIVERFGAKAVTLDQVMDAAAGGASLPERAVVLTFDDGRACLKTAALPVLQRHGMTAEVFVVTGWTAPDEAHRKGTEDETGKHAYLTWPELRELAASGAFHVQSHSVSHRRLRELTAEERWRELRDSRVAITANVGVPVNFFAYPFGAVSLGAAEEAERAGYRAALVVDRQVSTRFALRRRSVWKGCEYAVTDALEAAFGAPPK